MIIAESDLEGRAVAVDGSVGAPHLTSISLIVSDLAAAIHFYSWTLGFKLISEFPGDYASLQSPGGITLGLHVAHEGHTHRVETAGVELGFSVDDVDAWHARLIAVGVQFVRAPTDMPWGAREAQLADPDGHVLTVKTAIKTSSFWTTIGLPATTFS
jgi:catechol 2,3-dioxygenase-like lactoylglutathione lyase family enzyme